MNKTDRNPNLQEKYLDGEKLFRQYFEMGESRSVYLLTEWAIMHGMKSSKGKNPTPMGVWKSIWRWASMGENKHIAFDIAKQYLPLITWEQWVKDMIFKIESAWQHSTNSKKEKFLRENGWIDA